jgi:hypothetical protein
MLVVHVRSAFVIAARHVFFVTSLIGALVALLFLPHRAASPRSQ